MENIRYGDRELSYRFHKLSFLLERLVGPALLEQAGLSFSQYKILMVLNHNADATGSHIAQYLGLTEAAVSRQVSQLVERGYLKQELDKDNRRQHLLTVTARGKAMTDKTRLVLSKTLEPIYSDQTEAARQALGAALDHLILRARTMCDASTKPPTKPGEK